MTIKTDDPRELGRWYAAQGRRIGDLQGRLVANGIDLTGHFASIAIQTYRRHMFTDTGRDTLDERRRAGIIGPDEAAK